MGFAFWETSQASLAHRLGLAVLDEVWVSSEYCREVFQKATDKPVVVMRTPIPRFDDLSWATRDYFGIPRDKFTYVFTFDGASRVTRKNPVAVVEAFQRAFPTDEGVQLVINTQNTKLLSPSDETLYADIRRRARRDRRIMVIDESFTSNEVHALIPVPEQDFVYAEAGQEWAEPDVEHAAKRMLEVRTDPNKKTKIQRAFERINELYGEAVVGEAYRARIEAIRSSELARIGEVHEEASSAS